LAFGLFAFGASEAATSNVAIAIDAATLKTRPMSRRPLGGSRPVRRSIAVDQVRSGGPVYDVIVGQRSPSERTEIPASLFRLERLV
jgi:hypothetical protein